nr:major facilitator superfamily domain-containing protein 3-like [Lepeophtheirus salmonis]
MESNPLFLKKLFLLFTLYFVQACPYGFQAGCLPIILRQNGLSFANLGAIKLLFLPWICKPLISLKVEQKKQFWIFFTLIGLAFICFWSADHVSIFQLFHVSLMLLSFNFLCATLDICVDSLSVSLLDDDELGAASTIQVVAYKTGAAVSGGLLLLLHEHFGWATMFYLFGMVYLFTVIGLYSLNTIPIVSIPEHKVHQSMSIIETWKELNIPGTTWVIYFVLIYKLNTHSSDIVPLFMSDKGLPTNLLAIGNTIGRIFSIIGSTYSGYLLTKKRSAIELIEMFCTIQLFSIFVQFCFIYFWGSEGVDLSHRMDIYLLFGNYITLYWNLFCSGAITTACFTMMMSLSKKVPLSFFQGTYFSLLCTFEILGKVLFASTTGLVTDVMGPSFSVFCCMGLTALVLSSLKWSPLRKSER